MNIVVIGAGGVGGYFGGKLALAGNNVTFIARGKHLEALNQNGLLVKSIAGDFHVKNVIATDKVSSIKNADLIMIAVKAWQVKEIAAEIKKIISASTIVLPLQNGIKAAGELIEILGEKHVLGGLCFILSKIESPGVINHFGIDPSLTFGELDNSKTERTKKLSELLTTSGINAIHSDDIQASLWKKFIGICVSGLLAVTHCTYGQMREVKETKEMTRDLLQEIYAVSQKEGIHIDPGYVEKFMIAIDTFPSDSVPSLTRDVWEGRPSEIFYQNGTVVELGKKHGIPTPVNSFVFNSILPRELRIRNKK